MVNGVLRALALLLTALMLFGCDRRQSTPPAALEPMTRARPILTKAEWEAGVRSAIKESQTESDGTGVTKFVACLGAEGDKKCPVMMFARRDAFKHVTILRPVMSSMNELGVDAGGANYYIHAQVVLTDCERPLIVLMPSFFSKSGWIFLRAAAIMADGRVILERTFEHNAVSRDNASWGVKEKAAWVASAPEIEAVRKIATASTAVIRLTGERGFVTVPPARTKEIQNDFAAVLQTFDLLSAAVTDKIPPKCE